MDNSSVDSELIESLDFLRPPVHRNYKTGSKGASGYLYNPTCNTNKCYSKDFLEKISAETHHSYFKIRGAETSTSLVLNKTSKKVDRYSVLSYTDLLYPKTPKLSCSNSPTAKGKPIVKVTVTPKATQTNVSKRQKPSAKRVQATVSNQESSIHNKNVYLVVKAGRKKEKVYQIKTTESAKFNNCLRSPKDEVIPIKQLSSLKLILNSLNMEKRKEKNKKRRKKSQQDESLEVPQIAGGSRDSRECFCSRGCEEEKSPNLACRRSSVRITGQLGLDDDDRYVLRCAATVNDKPVAQDFTEIGYAPTTHREERRILNICDENSCPARYKNTATFHFSQQKRDCKIQTDLQNDNTIYGVTPMKTAAMASKETQATQVDFNMGLASDLTRRNNSFPFKDEIVQCHRASVDTRASPCDSDSDPGSAKDTQSPLVIISVYPAPDCSDNASLVENYQNDNINSTRKTIFYNQSTKQRPSRDNSNIREKMNEKKALRQSRSPSPNVNQNRNSYKISMPIPTTVKNRKPSPNREVPTSINSRATKPVKDITANRPLLNKERIPGSKSPQRHIQQRKDTKESKGTNTDANITKKIIVDNYTKKLTAYMNKNTERRVSFPQKNTSQIAVDIDGTNEHYDFLFQQDNATTDLKIKKTIKSPQTKVTNNLAKIFPPMKRSSVMPDESRRRQSTSRNQQSIDDPQLTNNTFARLQLRDSIEISRRHDPQTTKGKSSKNFKDDASSDLFSAPIKHYTGDNCTITDPIKRDKEIRSLLGIDKGVHTSIPQDFKIENKKYSVPLHYIYNKTCKKKIVTGINLMQMPIPPCVCCDIKKSFYSESGSIHSRKMSSQAQRAPVVNAESLHVNKTQHQEDDHNQESSDTAGAEDDNMGQVKSSKTKVHDNNNGNNTGTQYETQVQRTSLYQQLILNRNIQVFLQVEQFSKQKPIVLSRKQYDKVKRTIENTIASKGGREYKRKKCICRTSLVSVGDVRMKSKHDASKNRKPSNTDKKDLGVIAQRSTSSTKSVRIMEKPCACEPVKKLSKNTLVLFSKEKRFESHPKSFNEPPAPAPLGPRHTVSSLELRYASLSYMRHVTFSSTNVEVDSASAALQQKESHSIHTIFKGHKKCHTPNLGTSMYSLCSEGLRSQVPPPNAQEPKRKPFLRRLMSCLVMRSTRVSEINNAHPSPTPKAPSINSSIDSYHISTSLGAIEVTSSIYDTSASFYTNHSIYPMNSKIKRGFFNSVREFLTSRKS